MKTIKGLNIQDKPGYLFMNMTNIKDLDPDLIMKNEFTITKDESISFDISYCEENNKVHVVFNDIEYIFEKGGVFSYLIFCESDKNKEILDRYIKIIDQIKE